MTEENRPVLVCRPDTPDFVPRPGAERVPCADCGRPVWVSPSSFKAMVGHAATVVCQACGLARADKTPPTSVGWAKEV